MPSLPSPLTRPPESCEAMTRDGLYLAIASMFGVRPDRLVTGTPGGKSESWSTATTWVPAPIAYRSSVAVGSSETIRFGWRLIVTLPLAAASVVGNTGTRIEDGVGRAGALAAVTLLLADEQPARAAAAATATRTAAVSRW